MQGMDTGPGTDLGDLAWYLGIWVTMMAAMVLPSVAPMVLLYSLISIAGGAIAAAGLYQLTPLKELCLRHCRGPMHFILHGWRERPDRRAPHGRGARALLRGLLLGTHGDPVHARSDEPLLDGGRRGVILR
jgi:predicted metal-binding membrane protein